MKGTLRDRTLALAGVFMCADLVRQVARTGNVDEADLQTCLGSLFVETPESTEAVYEHLIHVRRGLTVLIDQLGEDAAQRDLDIARYVITLLHLERKLSARPALLQHIETGLTSASAQRTHFPLTHANVIANLAQIYADTISTLNPRIMVSGEPIHLNNDANANKIRSLLLAGIRSAVLYYQVGGRRWHILLQRQRLLGEAKNLLQHEIPRSIN